MRVGMGLFEDICSLKNLFLGFDRVEENGGGPGVDGETVPDFSFDLDSRIQSLRKALIDGSYAPLPLRKTGVPKKSGKLRWLCIPAVRDRVVQTSAAFVLTPLLDPEFEDCSYAYRKNLSVLKAVRKVISLREQGYVWVVDADINSYFDEVDHRLLLAEVEKYVDDAKVVSLIEKWLNIDVVYQGSRSRFAKGIPQGSPVSPLLANLYLDSFDEALMKEKFRHVRFSDDFVILCKDKPDAEDALELTEEVLGGLKLGLNMEKTRIVNFNQGFRYLGMEFLRSMVFRPAYRDESPDEHADGRGGPVGDGRHFKPAVGETEVRRPDIHAVRTERVREGGAPEAGDGPIADGLSTQMSDAFEEALKEAGAETIDDVFKETPAVEPSASGNPLSRTLYLLEQGAVLKKEDEHFVIVKDGKHLKEIPAIKVDQIFVFGNVQITTQAMKFCLAQSIPLLLLSGHGSYFGTLESFGNVAPELHRRQFAIAEDGVSALGFGRAVVRTKIQNARVILQRYRRSRPGMDVDGELADMAALGPKITAAEDSDDLMGLEGFATARYYSGIRKIIGDQWGFARRQKRPPRDPINSLLSLGYTILYSNVYTMVRKHGLHPYIGLLHAQRRGHPSLVSDLVEEFRAPVVDAVVLRTVTGGGVKREGFLTNCGENSACLLSDQTRKAFLKALEGKMNSAVTHPLASRTADFRRCMDLQVGAFRKFVEGKSAQYEPFVIK